MVTIHGHVFTDDSHDECVNCGQTIAAATLELADECFDAMIRRILGAR